MGAAGALPTGARTRADTRVFQDTDPAPGGIAVETHTQNLNSAPSCPVNSGGKVDFPERTMSASFGGENLAQALYQRLEMRFQEESY